MVMFLYGISYYQLYVQMVLFDYVIWFYCLFCVDDWLLYLLDSFSVQDLCGLVCGQFFICDGVLVVSIVQEGLICVVIDSVVVVVVLVKD